MDCFSVDRSGSLSGTQEIFLRSCIPSPPWPAQFLPFRGRRTVREDTRRSLEGGIPSEAVQNLAPKAVPLRDSVARITGRDLGESAAGSKSRREPGAPRPARYPCDPKEKETEPVAARPGGYTPGLLEQKFCVPDRLVVSRIAMNRASALLPSAVLHCLRPKLYLRAQRNIRLIGERNPLATKVQTESSRGSPLQLFVNRVENLLRLTS